MGHDFLFHVASDFISCSIRFFPYYTAVSFFTILKKITHFAIYGQICLQIIKTYTEKLDKYCNDLIYSGKPSRFQCI